METFNYKSHAGVLLGLGLALIALGSLAIYSVVAATFASVIFFGWLLIIAGFIQFGHALYARKWNWFLLQILLSIFSIAAGGLILYNPTTGALSLTLLLSFLFIVQGAMRIVLALMKRYDHWVWVLISGILTLILGILILMQWPYSGLYIIGLFVGIDLIFNGWALVMLSFIARKLTR
jgi:uncharacterized membrane protein HdeD (DUF308 family)